MASTPLKVHGIAVRRESDEPATAVLTLLPTEGRGAMREVTMDRAALVSLIEDAAVALRRLEER